MYTLSKKLYDGPQ